ncbi:MFS transporter [Thioclava sp. 'Guangxiensis']|uniref:MFS transporter n=1 Tax=Thioclava sp. 'Guangxiensis' TaxID=3149044 RepID=UPI00387818B5
MTHPDPHAVPTRSERHRIAIACTVSLVFLMQGIDTTILTVAIPGIAADLQRSPLSLHLLVSAYLLALAVFMPVASWFSDRLGPRRLFCLSVLIFMAGSVLTAFMPTLGLMIPCRMLQGFGGALMTPVGRLIVLRAFGPGRTIDAMTWLAIPTMVGPLIGPLLGAVLVEMFDWRLLFVVNTPLAIAAILGVLRLVPPLPAVAAGRFDTRGFLLAGLALVTFQLAIEALGLWGGIGLTLLPVSALVFWVYTRHARTREKPALDISLFHFENFRIGVLAGGLGRAGLNAMAFLLPLFLQLGLGFRPLQAGLISALAAFSSLASKPVLKHVIRRLGFRRTLVALTVAGSLSMAAYATVSTGWPVMALVGMSFLAGAVRILYFNSVQSITFTGLPAERLSSATATAGVIQQLCMGLGISLSAALLSALQGEAAGVGMRDFNHAFLIMAVLPLLSLPLLMTRAGGRQEPAAAPLRKTNPEKENKSIGAIARSIETTTKAGERAPERASDTAA